MNETKKKKVLISTGGGDAPGLNSVIRAAVKHGILTYDWEMIGSMESFNGLLSDPMRLMPLKLESVNGLLVRGGTILGTTNRGGPFHFPQKDKAGNITYSDRSDDLIQNIRKIGVDAVISIGGEGSQGISQKLFEMGLPIVGVPKTIDNDLDATEMTFGFQTAVATATDAIDKLQSTAESHDRVMVLEVMGRDAGWIAMASGIAGGAHVILIPEIPFDMDKVIARLQKRNQRGTRFAIVVVAEGAYPKGQKHILESSSPKGCPPPLMGGMSQFVASEIARRTEMETRVTVLGHLQRGGTPTPMDRLLATRFGVAAIDLVAREDYGHMVALQSDKIISVPISEAISRYRTIPANHDLIHTAKAIGVCVGD